MCGNLVARKYLLRVGAQKVNCAKVYVYNI